MNFHLSQRKSQLGLPGADIHIPTRDGSGRSLKHRLDRGSCAIAVDVHVVLKNDVSHGLTVSPPNRDKLTMRINSLKTLNLILSLSKDEAKISCFFSSLLVRLIHGKS